MSQKCVAITRAGEPCKNWAERDQSDHCVKHRGWSDNDERAVAVAASVAPLVVKAYKCPHCGELSEMR
jgi:hypothetical protein